MLDDIDEAIGAFSLMNSTGQNLTILDLLKSEIFTIAQKDKKIKQFDDQWQNFISVLNSENLIYKNDYDKFLQHFLFSRFKHTKKTELKSNKNEWMKDKKDSIWIIEDMTKYMNSFLYIFKEDDVLSSEIKLLGFQQHIPIAINIYEKFQDSYESLIIQKIHELLISIVVINDKQANVLESIMLDLFKEIKEAKEIEEIIQKIDEYISETAGDDIRTFIDKIMNIDFKKTNYVKYFFSKTSLDGEEKINWKKSSFEHICPVNPTKWKEENPRKNFKDMIYKIGNGTILDNKLNTIISNETFAEKKKMILKKFEDDKKRNAASKGKKTNNLYHKMIEEE